MILTTSIPNFVDEVGLDTTFSSSVFDARDYESLSATFVWTVDATPDASMQLLVSDFADRGFNASGTALTIDENATTGIIENLRITQRYFKFTCTVSSGGETDTISCAITLKG